MSIPNHTSAMKSLRLIPGTHNQKEIVKVLFPFDPGIPGFSFTIPPIELLQCLRHIQTLVGHNSLKTTEIYTQGSGQEIGKIKKTLDDFYS